MEHGAQNDVVANGDSFGSRVRQYKARGNVFVEYSDEDVIMFKFTGTKFLERFCAFSNKPDGFLCAKLGKSGDVSIIVQLLVLLRHKSKIVHLHFLKATVNAEAECNLPFLHRDLNTDTDHHQAEQFCLNVVTSARDLQLRNASHRECLIESRPSSTSQSLLNP